VSDKLSDNATELTQEELNDILKEAEANTTHLSQPQVKGYCKNCKYFKVVSPHTFIYEYDKITDNLCYVT